MILYDIVHIFRYSMASANFSRLTGLYVWLIQISLHMMSHTANDIHSSGISRIVREILSEGPIYIFFASSNLH